MTRGERLVLRLGWALAVIDGVLFALVTEGALRGARLWR